MVSKMMAWVLLGMILMFKQAQACRASNSSSSRVGQGA
jgi:hypothetical protein